MCVILLTFYIETEIIVPASQTRVFVWYSTLIFPFYKKLVMNRLEFSCFVVLLYSSLKSE
jgi:hypothetical protein